MGAELTEQNADVAHALYLLEQTLTEIKGLLRTATLPLQDVDEPFDQTYVATTPVGPQVVTFTLPRTLRHVEIELSGIFGGNLANGMFAALLQGNVTAAQAAQQVNFSNAAQSNAICVTTGGKVTARDFLDQSGYLTVYFSDMTGGTEEPGLANVRVRSLDKTPKRR